MKNKLILFIGLMVLSSCWVDVPEEGEFVKWTTTVEIPFFQDNLTLETLAEDSLITIDSLSAYFDDGENTDSIFVYHKSIGINKVEVGNKLKLDPVSTCFSQDIDDVTVASIQKNIHRWNFFWRIDYCHFDFIWQPASNPAVIDYFKLDGQPRGVLVIKPGEKSALKLHDIILEVGGFPIDIQGDYLDPNYGHVIMEYLACRNKWAGDTVKLKIWRGGKVQDIDYELPKADFSDNLVMDRPNDVEPTYLIAGGLVFVPLSAEFLSSWGSDWQRSAPFRLVFYNNQKAQKNQKSLVVLSLVLPDFYNIGYQQRSSQNIVIEKANGNLISTLEDLSKALESPKDGFHVFEFKKGSSLEKIILSAEQLDEANQRIAQRYGITQLQKLD